MFLRSTNGRKDGKDHRCFSIVENRRLPGGRRRGAGRWKYSMKPNGASPL
jgi:hypothetical protein